MLNSKKPKMTLKNPQKMLIRTTLIILTLLQVTKSTIYVETPVGLRKEFRNKGDDEGNIEYTISTFGYVDYQLRTRMVLVKAPTDDGCAVPMIEELPTNTGPTESPMNTAYIMKRGNCTFYKKAQNIHQMGGKLAIVTLNKKHNNPAYIIPIGPKQQSDKIPPVILIKEREAEVLYKALEEKKKVILSVHFETRIHEKDLNITVNAQTTNENSYTFLAGLLKYHKVLRNHTKFDIYFMVHAAAHYGIKPQQTNLIEKYCYKNNAKYCYRDSRFLLDNPMDAILEAVVQSCAHKAMWFDKDYDEFIQYLEDVRDLCIKDKNPQLYACTEEVRAKFEFFQTKKKEIQPCIDSSLEVTASKIGDSKIVEFFEKQKQLVLHHWYYQEVPSVFIDNRLVRGYHKSKVAISAICDSFLVKPEACSEEELKYVEQYFGKKDTLVDYTDYLLLGMSIVVISIVSFLLFKKCSLRTLENDLRARADEGVADYHRIQDGTEGSAGYKTTATKETEMSDAVIKN